MRYCEYSEAFGPVGAEAHFHRNIFGHGVAIVDVILTLVGALIFALIGSRFSGRCRKIGVSKLFGIFLTLLFVASIVLHHMFCVCSTVNSLIFPQDPMCYNASGVNFHIHNEL